MSARLVWSHAALADLERVWDEVFEASADVETTDAYLDGLRAAVRAKAAFPRSGHPVEYFGLFTGFFWVRWKAYLVFYRIRDGRKEVARVLFSRQDTFSVLLGELGKDGEESGEPS